MHRVGGLLSRWTKAVLSYCLPLHFRLTARNPTQRGRGSEVDTNGSQSEFERTGAAFVEAIMRDYTLDVYRVVVDLAESGQCPVRLARRSDEIDIVQEIRVQVESNAQSESSAAEPSGGEGGV